MWKCVALILTLTLTLIWTVMLAAAPEPVAQILLPAGALAMAAADIARVDAPLRESMRYLWVPPHVGQKDLDTVYRVLCGHCNSMSREPDIVPLFIVPGSGSRLFRLSLKDYRWDRKVWESFANMPDPYFYDLVDEYWPGGSGYAAGTYKTPAVAAWAADGPGRQAAVSLLAAMQPADGSKTQAPIVSVTSFVFTTFVSVNGKPRYNDFLQIKTEADYFKATGVRADEDEAFEANMLAVIAESGITYEPRAIEKRSKVGGELWRSHDFIKATGAADPFRNLGRDGKKSLRAKSDAHENFAHAANGFWIMGLFNGAGEAQDSAPDNITSGDTTTTNTRDHRVHLPLSCVRCHDNAGLKDLDDWVRNLQQPPPTPPLSLLIGNKDDPKNVKPVVDEALRFRRQYGRSLIPSLEMGRQRFAVALAEATGLKPDQYASGYGTVWNLIAEPRIDSQWAARDLGCSEAELVGALDKQVKVAGGTDPVLAGFLKPRAAQRPLQLRQWLETYPRAQKALRGVVDVKLEKPKGKP
jgi:hypothetical protein